MHIRESTSWVVYQVPMKNKAGAVNAICERHEWDTMEAGRPGYYTLIRTGIPSEAEAERLARGEAGEAKAR